MKAKSGGQSEHGFVLCITWSGCSAGFWEDGSLMFSVTTNSPFSRHRAESCCETAWGQACLNSLPSHTDYSMRTACLNSLPSHTDYSMRTSMSQLPFPLTLTTLKPSLTLLPLPNRTNRNLISVEAVGNSPRTACPTLSSYTHSFNKEKNL